MTEKPNQIHSKTKEPINVVNQQHKSNQTKQKNSNGKMKITKKRIKKRKIFDAFEFQNKCLKQLNCDFSLKLQN